MPNDPQSLSSRTSNPDPQPPLELCAAADPTRKRLGEAAEAAFLARAASLGFRIASPWGDSDRYDFLIGSAHGFWRVQVKCTHRYAESRYRVKNAGNSSLVYTADEIDFIAALIVPLDLWYIIPIEAAGRRKSLRFYPHHGRNSLLEKYREAWCLLDCPRSRRVPITRPERTARDERIVRNEGIGRNERIRGDERIGRSERSRRGKQSGRNATDILSTCRSPQLAARCTLCPLNK